MPRWTFPARHPRTWSWQPSCAACSRGRRRPSAAADAAACCGTWMSRISKQGLLPTPSRATPSRSTMGRDFANEWLRLRHTRDYFRYRCAVTCLRRSRRGRRRPRGAQRAHLRCPAGARFARTANGAGTRDCRNARPRPRPWPTSAAWVVWSPRSNLDLYGNTAPVTLLDRFGIGIALGTDWLASGSMNLLRELAAPTSSTISATGGTSPTSSSGAWSRPTQLSWLVSKAELGLLAPGQLADLAVFDAKGRTDHRAVIAAEPADVVLVLRGGRPLYGDQALLASPALGAAACEPLTVCDTPKLVCAAGDTGVSLADLASAAQAVHPLFFCGAPAPEPSCVPFRTGEYDGSRSPTDADGDGVADAADRCPQVFDPPRPMDATEQADSDGDGRGDACDPCPLDAGDACCAAVRGRRRPRWDRERQRQLPGTRESGTTGQRRRSTRGPV